MKQRVSSGAKWEATVGYSRAVRSGNIIEVAGTTAVVDGEVAFAGDAYKQTQCILGIIGDALQKLGAGMHDVVRTRIYLADVGDWQAVGRAHGEMFGDIRPASTMLAVGALIHPDMLVEIEVTAIID